MHKISAFAQRNVTEILRDPLSYAFCAGFPLVMLALMTVVDQSIPAQAGMTIFHIDNLCGGVMIFGQMFVMLFTAITVAKDRAGAFLLRMYATPMRSPDFILGYAAPMLGIALVQALVIGVSAVVIALITGTPLGIGGVAAALPALMPSALLFTGFGLLFGTLFSEKAAPGLCSVIISLGSFLGGIWFDPDQTGGVLLTLSRLTPFYHASHAARAALKCDFSASGLWLPLAIVSLWAVAILALSAVCFHRRMKADLA